VRLIVNIGKMREDGWRDKEEDFLTKLETQCNTYAKYFAKDYLYYHALASKFNIPILVTSALNSLCAIALNDFLPQKFVSILNAILSAGTGVLGSIQLYMKINEKMANATRSQVLMKRLALKISKELSVDRDTRSSDGQVFLQECFSEFNAALEQSNPIERKLQNFLSLDPKKLEEEYESSVLKFAGSAMNLLSPRKGKHIPDTDKTPETGNTVISNRRELPFDDSPRSPFEEV
jgi:hypothetical protein